LPADNSEDQDNHHTVQHLPPDPTTTMPYYEVNHAVSLTEGQKSDLANAITQIHSTKFTTPRMFVNVKYTDISQTLLYIGGKRKTKSHMMAHVRTGPSRGTAAFNDLCTELNKAWDSIVPLPKIKRSLPDEDRTLYSIFVLGDIVAGQESGFNIPEAGKDLEWLAANMAAFKSRAADGQEEFGELVREVEERGMLKGHKSAMERLEEELGWGDSA